MTAERLLAMAGDWWMPEPNTGCWLWFRATTAKGYGSLKENGRDVHAHRVAYEAFRGPIPPGLQIDHLCRVRCCVNPDHLEAVTQRENLLRGVGRCAINARKEHCKRGHPLSGDNLIVYPNGYRNCRECRNMADRQRRAVRRKKAAQ